MNGDTYAAPAFAANIACPAENTRVQLVRMPLSVNQPARSRGDAHLTASTFSETIVDKPFTVGDTGHENPLLLFGGALAAATAMSATAT